MVAKIKNNIFIIFILAIGVFLAVKNYTPGTFLSGWDTLHPEFNFGVAFQRELNGVFRGEMGLGAVAAHSHMADLPHALILYLAHFVTPPSDLRYLYIFLNLIIGPIGMYFFLNKYIVKTKIVSFLGSLFYLLNLGTMQIFTIPFEMFTTQYALLPWLFLSATDYLFAKEKSVNRLLLFLIATLFATPMAYAATLWYIYFFVLILYLFFLNLLERSFSILKRSSILIATTLLINLFWILPNIYFAINQGSQVANALINQLFSSQAFLYNKEFGNIQDIAFMKSFLFDWNVYAGKNNFIPLLSPWINHLNQIPSQVIGYIFAITAFVGILTGIFKKNKVLISLIAPLLLCFFFLINDNPPTSFLYNFLQNKIPLFKEAFRFPGDKVLGIFTFLFTLYFSAGQSFLTKTVGKISKFKTHKAGEIIPALIFIFLIFCFMLPAFKGNLISPYMRIEIPKSYFEMFNWFNNQPLEARVANLPINSLWGWKYYGWQEGKPSFQGADFLQFGIKQPLLDRDFDRWNPANEQYYREMSQAIYGQNSANLENVLKKFDISYILLDKNVIAPEQKMTPQILFLKETESLLNSSNNIQQVFHSDNLFVYQVTSRRQKVRIIKNPPSIELGYLTSYDDFIFSKYGDYVTYQNAKRNTIIYPFGDIINNNNLVSSNINFPASLVREKQYSATLSSDLANDCPASTIEKSKSKIEMSEDKSGKFLRYSSPSGQLCNHYSFSNIPRDQGYLISITSRNISGLPLKLCVTNYISRRCDMSTQLSSFPTFKEDVFLLPPMGKEVGLDINLNNFAIKKSPSINDLKSIKITTFSYSEVLQTEQYAPANGLADTNFAVLSQSFDSGWKAYGVKNINWLNSALPFLFGKELKEHVLVNNWANGWVMPSSKSKVQSSKFIIIFWPQYLEYLGFGILIATFAWLIYVNFKHSPKLDLRVKDVVQY